MAVYQIFVKLLDGRTQCLQIPSPTITGKSLKLLLSHRTLVRLALHRLVSGTREISDETLISVSGDGLFPSCGLLLRLPGGKGGFGSLLRGAATKAGQKKTSNFDACRDMSGRRLRHVNAEKRLEEWRAEAEERELEKIAEDFIRKKEKEEKKTKGRGGDVEKYLEKYRKDAAKCVEEVEESVRESFELYKKAKRKVLPSAGADAKRLKIWLGKQVDESDSDEDDDDEDDNKNDGDERSMVLDAENSEVRIREDDGSQGSVSGVHSDVDSLGGGSVQSNMVQENGICEKKCVEVGEVSGSGADSHSDSDGLVEPQIGIDKEIAAKETVVLDSSSEGLPEPDNSESVVDKPTECDVEIGKPVECEVVIGRQVDFAADCEEPLVLQSNGVSTLEEPLDFNNFNSAAELEVLGMERLKMELQSHGLKCGGTLQERAARLFLLKTNPIDKLPKKVLARPVTGGNNASFVVSI